MLGCWGCSGAETEGWRDGGMEGNKRTHSVSKRPGRIALTRILGPWDIASHFIRCRPINFFLGGGGRVSSF